MKLAMEEEDSGCRKKIVAAAKREIHRQGFLGRCAERRAHSVVVVVVVVLLLAVCCCAFSACRAVQKNFCSKYLIAQLPPVQTCSVCAGTK